MPGRWDTSTKRLVGEKPEHFVRWLVKEAEFKGKAKLKPTSLNTREREVDNLYQIKLFGLYYLVHIEFQTYYDDTMAKRMWEYNVLATFSYDCPTYSFVIYLKECEVPESFYEWKDAEGKAIHHFNFRIIKLWETPLEELRQTGLAGILPLMVLARDGNRPEVVDEVITRLEKVRGKTGKELLALAYILASLVFQNEADRTWLKRRFNMLQDVLRTTWAYQEIMEEGFEKGVEKGVEKEREQELQRQRQMLMTIVQTNFPNIVDLAKTQTGALKDPDILQSLILKVFSAKSEEEAKQALLSVGRKKKRK